MNTIRARMMGLALFAASMGLIVAACHSNKGGDNNGSTSLFESPTAASAPAPAPATAATPTPGVVGGRDGVEVELLSSNFDPERCTRLLDENGNPTPYTGIDVFEEIARVTNNTKIEGYPKPALFQNPRASCDAWDKNPAGPEVLAQLIIGEHIPPGESREWTHRLVLPPNFCGSFQFDNDFRNGEVAVSSMSGGGGGKVINSGRDCPNCDLYGLQVSVSGEGLTRSVTVNFTHPKGNKKAIVNFGDGSPEAEFARGESKDHTFPYGAYTVTVRLEDRELPEACTAQASVRNSEPTCQNYEAPTITGDISVSVGDDSVTFGSGTVAPGGGWFSPSLPAEIDRPAYGQPDGTFSTTYTVPYGPEQLECSTSKEFSKSVPARTDPCADVDPPSVQVSCTPSTRDSEYDSVKCTATSSVPAKFDWSKTQIQANTFGGDHCSKEDEKWFFFWELQENDWRIEVTATACDECKKQGSASTDVTYVEPPPPICHTQNIKYCRSNGSDCENKSDESHQRVKWQCQNRPPGTPGHYPNHFNDLPTHDDFFGSCNYDKCYNIVN